MVLFSAMHFQGFHKNYIYVSVESALSYYGLRPERVYTTRSITTNRLKKFENSVGHFDYVTVNDAYINFKHTGLLINIS